MDRTSAGSTHGLRDGLIRAGASVGILTLVLWRVDLQRVVESLQAANVAWLAIALVLAYAAVLIGTLGWRVILRSRSVHLDFSELVRYYLMGLFFNNFLPTAIGGDVMRGYEVGRRVGDGPVVAASILADRLLGAITLALVAVAGAALVRPSPWIIAAVVALLAGSLALYVVLRYTHVADGLVERTAGGRLHRAGTWASTSAAALKDMLADREVVIIVGILSLVFQALIVAIVVAIFAGLGVAIDIGRAVLYVPLISAITMLPVSLNGLGLREAAYVYFFTKAGATPPEAAAAALVFFAVVGIASIPGGIAFAVSRRDRGRAIPRVQQRPVDAPVPEQDGAGCRT